MADRAVVDASVAAKWLWVEEKSRSALELAEDMERRGTILCAPDLMAVELHPARLDSSHFQSPYRRQSPL